MKLNVAKSGAMRIGDRWQSVLPNLRVGEDEVVWVKEMTYLGVVIVAGRTFSIDCHLAKRKYYGSLNAILGRVADMSATSVLLHLTFTNCSPALLYGLEASNLTKAQLKSLTCAYNASFFKLFGTFDAEVIKNCQFYSGYLPLNLAIDLKVLKFLHSMKAIPMSPTAALLGFEGGGELRVLEQKYGVNDLMSPMAIKMKIRAFFAALCTE